MNDAFSSGLVRGYRFLLLAAAATAGTACGGAAAAGAPADGAQQGADSKQGAAEPGFDLEAAMKRESDALSDSVVSEPGGAWSAKVPAAGAPRVSAVDDVGVVEIPIGSTASVRCQVHPDTIDVAGTMYNVIKQSSDKVEYRSVQPTGVHVLSGAPAVFVDGVYLTDTKGGKAAGTIKLAIQSRESRALFCLHDELGYRQTFEKVAKAFFDSFQERGAPKSAATYSEVSKVRLDDMDVGFSVTRLLPAEKPAERRYVDISASFIPTSPKDVIFEDSYTLLDLNTKGQLLKGTWVEASGGDITLKMFVTRDDGGKLHYEGEVSGKPLKGELNAPKGLSTSLDIAAMLKKKLKAGSPFEETLAEYHPSIDPTATIAVKYSHAKGAPPRQVVCQMGERAFTAEVDDDGMSKTGFFEIGKRRLSFSREHVVGHP
jgi:hypothetical protein